VTTTLLTILLFRRRNIEPKEKLQSYAFLDGDYVDDDL
jgi:hypothetical protein